MDRLEELQVFLAIAEHGSLAEAARRTGRSPPAVTRILGEMEERYGVRLASRTTRRFALTEAGQRLAAHAERLLGEFESAERDVAGEAAAPRGRLRLSAPQTFGRMHLMPVVLEFLRAHPEIAVELALEDRPIDLIEEGVDLALRIAHLDASSLVARRIGAVRRVVVASPDYLARRGTPDVPEDLARHAIVLFQNQANGPHWAFELLDGVARTVRVTARLTVNRSEAAIDAARRGHGIARVLSYQVADDIRRGALVRLLGGFERRPIPVHLVFPSARLLAPRVRVFLDFAVPRLAALDALQET